MDYNKEIESLKRQREFWKPTAGQWQVKVQSEEEPDQFIDSDGIIHEQIRLDVAVMGTNKPGKAVKWEEFTWTVTKAKTLSSLYGQLMLLGQKKKQLNGIEFSLFVSNDGKKNSYTIPETLEMQKEILELSGGER